MCIKEMRKAASLIQGQFVNIVGVSQPAPVNFERTIKARLQWTEKVNTGRKLYG